jgi:hypothetical protein
MDEEEQEAKEDEGAEEEQTLTLALRKRTKALGALKQATTPASTQVKEHTLQVITDKRPGHFVIDDGNVIDSGASVTLFNPNSRRLIPPMISVHPPMEIKGVGGKPFLVKKKCSAYIHYTDVSGKRNKFILSNVYVRSAVRVPLISVSHLVSRDCEVHMTKSGHSIIFPDKSVSELVTMRNGLITLMPYSSKECRSMIAEFHKRDNDRQANLVQVMETNHETNISVIEDMTTDPDMPASVATKAGRVATDIAERNRLHGSPDLPAQPPDNDWLPEPLLIPFIMTDNVEGVHGEFVSLLVVFRGVRNPSATSPCLTRIFVLENPYEFPQVFHIGYFS